MSPGGDRGHRFLLYWAVSTLALFALMVTWSIATPLGAASDEPAQIIKAAAVARGEFLGSPVSNQTNGRVGHEGRAVMRVDVPATYAEDANLPLCFRHHAKINAACAPAPVTSGQIMAATTYVGRYPPLYYLIVGSPSRLLHSGAGIYWMRVLSSLASAALLGLAFAASARWSRRPLLTGGVALAITPMVVFLGSVVNPSGLEITASIAAWTTGLVLVMDHRTETPLPLVVAFAVSSCVLESIRGLSPLWLALILLTLVALEPRNCWQLLRRRAVRIAAVVTVAVGVLDVIYIVLADALVITPSGIPLPRHATAMTVVNLYETHSSFYVTQVVGVFGWLDTSSPILVVLLVGLVMAGLIWLALATSKKSHAVVLIALLAVAIVLPVVIDVKNSLQLHNDVWQSRYALPLYVGVPLVSASMAGRRKTIRAPYVHRMVIAVAVVVAGCQFVCFFIALHRYTVGIRGGENPFAHVAGSWAPPLPGLVLLALAALWCAAYGWWIVRLARLGAVDQLQTTADTTSDPPAGPPGEPRPQPVDAVLAGSPDSG